MSILKSSFPQGEQIAEILASPAYQERCDLLFELFKESRKLEKNPNSILIIQAGAIELLNHFQGKKVEFKNENNELGVAVVDKLILLVKRILDSVIWRLFHFDRVLFQLFSEHPKTGFIDETVFDDFAIAQNIVEKSDSIVFLNDLTTVLRHADLTIIGENGVSVQETKHGKASRKNRRATRQRKRLNNLISFLNTGYRERKDRRDFIFKADIPLKTYHSLVNDVLNQARSHGYWQAILSDSVALEAIYMKNTNVEFKRVQSFNGVRHVAKHHNFQIFNISPSRIAPYGIFPLDDRNCFDLMTGTMFLTCTINFESLQKNYKSVGLSLELPEPNRQEIETYITAHIANQKRLMHQYKFVIRDDGYFNTLTPDIFARIGLEFLHEDTFVQATRQFMNLAKDLGITSDDKRTRFYTGFIHEAEIWV